jgi:hypothetical protein
MNNFIIGTIRENISLLFNNLHVINDSIPKKLDHLSDLAGRWTVNDTGDIIPVNPGAVGIGTLDNPIKDCFVSIIKGPAELVIDPSPVSDNSGTVRIKGNLVVDGTQTIINSTVVSIDDNIISIKGSDVISSGIEIKTAEGGELAKFSYDGVADLWKTNNKNLDIGTGKLIVEDLSISSVGKVLLTGLLDADEVINITVSDILTGQNVNVETGIMCITLVDSSTQSGSTGIYLATKIYNNFFYTVLLEKNTGLSILNFASDTGILTIKGANSGVSYEIKKININKILN